MKTLGEIIKEFRETHNLSLREFAKLCNMSHSYIDRLEKGYDPRSGAKVEPTLDTLDRISKAMNIPLDNLLKEIGYINAPHQLNSTESTRQKITSLQNDSPEGLTKRDLKSIEKDLEKMIEEIKTNPNDGFAAYGGEIDDEDIELLENAFRTALITIKKINKQKYTPKKYRKKDNEK